MSADQCRILLAEDTPAHARLLVRALTRGRPQVHVTVVESGESLLAHCRSETFDCVLLDFNLPDTRADQLLTGAGDLLAATPVVVISSSQEQEVVIAAMRSGVVDFIPKMQAIAGDELWRRVWMAVETARKKQQKRRRAERRTRMLAALAETDPLTGLSNRRHFQRLLDEQHWQNDRRQSLCCILLDIDHFKSINDRLGHPMGDQVLQRVARIIKTQADASDITVRWGGEEFLILSSRGSETQSWLLAENLRQAIRAGTGDLTPELPHVTVSLGVHHGPTRDFSAAIVEQSDQALYLAKRQGRNRTCSWPMTGFYRLAQDTAGGALADLDARLQQWLVLCRPHLGPAQWEHLHEHGRYTAALAGEIAQRMGLAEEAVQRLSLAGRMLDLGMACTPEELLAKPAPLTADERPLLDLHTRMSAELAQLLGAAPALVQCIRHHHGRPLDESWPTELPSLDATELGVLPIADALAAMTHDRPYARTYTLDEAIGEVRRLRGTQYDSHVVDTLLHSLDKPLRLVA